jgi:hypothetical protein
MTKSSFETCGIDFSAALVAPFHRPLTEAEVTKYILEASAPPPLNGEMEIGDGWILSLFTITNEDGRAPWWGWVRGAFAVNEYWVDDYYIGNLTHLPTGYSMLQTKSAEDAAAIGDILAPLSDWSSFDVEHGKTQVLIVRNALKANGFAKANILTERLKKIVIVRRNDVETGEAAQ